KQSKRHRQASKTAVGLRLKSYNTVHYAQAQGSGGTPRSFLPHDQTVDIWPEDPHREDQRWPPSDPRERNRQVLVSRTPPTARFPQASRRLPQDKRPQPAGRPRHTDKGQRTYGAGEAFDRWTDDHVHHYGGGRPGDAVKGWRYSGGID